MGVNVDQTGDDVLSLQINTVLRSLSLPDLGEHTVLDGKTGPCESLILQKYICVLESHHVFSSQQKWPEAQAISEFPYDDMPLSSILQSVL